MVLDSLENTATYEAFGPRFKKAFAFLKKNAAKDLPVGRYEVDGEHAFALVQSYQSRPEDEAKWEAHRKYADIQFIAEGEEIIGWAPLDALTESEAYRPEKDIAFYCEIPMWTKLLLKKGRYGIFFPWDAHKPCCASPVPGPVRKIVVKVEL